MHLLAVVACLLSVIAEATIMYTEQRVCEPWTSEFHHLVHHWDSHSQVVGCYYGYYNIWLIYPPAKKTVEYENNRVQITFPIRSIRRGPLSWPLMCQYYNSCMNYDFIVQIIMLQFWHWHIWCLKSSPEKMPFGHNPPAPVPPISAA